MEEEGGGELRDLFGRERHAVVGDARGERGAGRGEAVGHAAAPAEADGAHLPVRLGMDGEEGDGRRVARQGLRAVERADHLASLVLVRGRAAEGGQGVHGERQEPVHGQAAGDALDVGVEAPVLVDDDHPRPLRAALEAGEVPARLRARRAVARRLGEEARVVLGDHRRLGVVVLQDAQERRRGRGPSRHLREAVHELPSPQGAVGIGVVETDDPLVHRAGPPLSVSD